MSTTEKNAKKKSHSETITVLHSYAYVAKHPNKIPETKNKRAQRIESCRAPASVRTMPPCWLVVGMLLLEVDKVLLGIQFLATWKESNVRESVRVNVGLIIIFLVLLVTGVAVASVT